MATIRKQYIGDGTYIYEERRNGKVLIYTSGRITDTNIIYLESDLESDIVGALKAYLTNLGND